MLLLTFGTDAQVRRTADKINAIHDHVHGVLDRNQGAFPAGTYYTAHDPELLRWVHATLLDVVPRAYELFVAPLTDAEKDRYCAEATAIGPLLGMPEDYLPASTAELRTYMDGVYASGAIQVTDRARWLAAELLAAPRPLPRWPALSWLNALPTLALLPDHMRRAFGLPWGPAERSTALAGAAVARQLVPRIPPLMRHWPASRRSP
jgi:uncharacterized protein (DUF2236 family)